VRALAVASIVELQALRLWIWWKPSRRPWTIWLGHRL